jgi:hypothetical protein
VFSNPTIHKDGFAVPSNYIPVEHSLIRYVPWAKLRKDEDDNVVGVLAVAFKLREGETDLSATWLEFFANAGARSAQVDAAIAAIRQSKLQPTAKSGFTLGLVGRIAAAANRENNKIRVLHEPMDDNQAHVGIHRWPKDNDDLFELLADEIWNELILNKNVAAG